MRVFRLRGDRDLCTAWSEGDDDARARLDAIRKGEPDPQAFLPQPCNFGPGEPGYPWLLSDCPHGAFGQELLVLSGKAQSALARHLEAPPGALIPLLPAGPGTQGYALFIPRRAVADAVDMSRSIVPYRHGASGELTRLDLRGETLPRHGIFSLPPAGGLFVTDTFADDVQAAALTGFDLTEMWNSEAGALELRRDTGPPLTRKQILARVRDKLGALGRMPGGEAADQDSYVAALTAAPILPDELVEALTDPSATGPAVAAGLVVLFHRDWLNGGLAQACSNMVGRLAAAVAAFDDCIGGDVAAAVAAAARLAFTPGGKDPWDAYVEAGPQERAIWDELDRRYRAASADDGRDVVETELLGFITRRPQAFGAVLQAAFRAR